MRKYLKELFNFIKVKDPSIKSDYELLLLPGVRAIMYYRISRYFYLKKWYWLSRYYMEKGKRKTGIEIYPGALIWENSFIDHGFGGVIGETTIIGNNVIIFHDVTLGATGKNESGKRHPTIGNNVFIGCGAKILGNINIGDNVKIGANAVVLESVESNSTMVGVPGQTTKSKNINSTTMPY